MSKECSNQKSNMSRCNCSYSSCSRKGNCCACLEYHLNMQELPACAFPNDVERGYDRSFQRFVQLCKDKYGIRAE